MSVVRFRPKAPKFFAGVAPLAEAETDSGTNLNLFHIPGGFSGNVSHDCTDAYVWEPLIIKKIIYILLYLYSCHGLLLWFDEHSFFEENEESGVLICGSLIVFNPIGCSNLFSVFIIGTHSDT